jgi:SPP1 gp7 family putative phage head morphogenesis protein
VAEQNNNIPDELLEAFVKNIHSGVTTSEQVDENIAAFVQKHLWAGAEHGYGKKIADVDFDTPDKIMMAKLEQNTFYFSAAKNYWHIKTLNEALVGEDGKALPWAKFKEKAKEINDQVLVHRLRSEYNHAIASSQMARKWVEIQEAKELYPYLRYRTAGDANVRADHHAWQNMLKPVDDVFWRTHYPPNGWNCRCTVEQVRDGKPSTKAYTSDSIQQIFQINVGQQAVVYPPRHPYYALAGESAETRMLKRNSKAYDKVAEFENGSELWQHALTDQRDPTEHLRNLEQATFWAKHKKGVYKLLPHNVSGKSPELGFNEYVSDFKETKEKCDTRSVTRLIQDADDKQCDIVHINLVVIDTPEKVANALRYAFVSRQKQLQMVNKLYVRYKNNIIEFTAQEAIGYKHLPRVRWLLKHK